MKKEIMNCQNARQISILKTLAKLGHSPTRKSDTEAWFLSPFRSETKASFKVSIKQNYWIDFGTYEGGNVIDLVVKLKHCNVKEALSFLASNMSVFSFHQQPVLKKLSGKIEIQKVMSIQHLGLLNYLKSRKIPFSIAKRFCNEVWYQHNGKIFFAVGLKNHLGGWELRNKYFKTSTSPKTYSYIDQGHENLIVTEGMFDLLALESFLGKKLEGYDIIVLNSVAFVGRIASHIKDYKKIKLYLDNDAAGSKATEQIVKNFPQSIDCRAVYNGFKDANEKLMSWG